MKGGLRGGGGGGGGVRRRSEGEVREIEGAETMSINHMSVWIITTSLSNPLPTIFIWRFINTFPCSVSLPHSIILKHSISLLMANSHAF